MELKNQNILFFTRTMKSGGTENVVLQLCEIFQPLVNKIVVCSCGGVNVQKVTTMGIEHYTIPDIGQKNPLNMIRTCIIVYNILKKEKITIIHSHHRMAALFATLLSDGNVLKIANAHNTFYDRKLLTKIAYRSTNLIAVGEKVKMNLIDVFQIPSSQIHVIHNAIKPFSSVQDVYQDLLTAKEEGYTLIGNVGRLSKQKGMEYYILAASKVCKKYPKVKFFIVGDGEDYEKLKMLARREIPDGRLVFLGYRSDIQNVMYQMDFIVLSSLWEGFPLTPIEAFSVGKTIVATEVDGTPEIVRDGINGLLVQPENVEQLSEAIEKLITADEFRKKLEKNAKQTYESEFAFEQLERKYIDYYSRLI